MTKKKPFDNFLKELKKVIKKINQEDLEIFCQEVKKTKQIYTVGAGRSGLVAKNLAMRLIRLRKKTYVVGETINPAVNEGDLVIAISGSGETGSVLSAVKIARVKGAKILSLSAVVDSPLAKLSHNLILIPAQIPQRIGNQYQLRELIGVPERSPVKSLFEVCALIFLEVAVNKINGR